MNRRDLLKAFGIGSVVAPIIGTTPNLEAAARLIEVPKVEPVKLYEGFFPSNPYTGGMFRVLDPMPVWIADKKYLCAVQRLTRDSNIEIIDVTNHDSNSGFKEYIPGTATETLRITVILPSRI